MSFTAIILLACLAAPASGQMYRWVDEKGNVNFTDDQSSIPPSARKNSQTLDYNVPGAPSKKDDEPTGNGEQSGKKTSPPQLDMVMTAPLIPRGMSYTVETEINGGEKVNMLIDTGASFTIISAETAAKIGLPPLETMPKMPVSTAGGASWIYLVELEKVKVGGAEAQYVEAGISTKLGDGIGGLLGMSFLGEFIHQIDGPGGKLIMKPARGGQMFGGHDKGWWTTKYTHYAESVRRFRSFGDKLAVGVTAGEDPEMKKVAGFKQQDMKKIEDYYMGLFSNLERRASAAGVPRDWRVYP
ncbi:MAG: TIGR02281 family clan AA aspartic protease [Nitrospinae bacterium]|nr:TIGR02281 family clan AA aspartic protease [Nitrospinota bacterium]